MTVLKQRNFLTSIVLFLFLFVSCDEKVDEKVVVTRENAYDELVKVLSANSNYSEFTMLFKTYIDSTFFDQSGTTLFIPTDEYFTIEMTTNEDKSKLIHYLITNEDIDHDQPLIDCQVSVNTPNPQVCKYLETLSGKYASLEGSYPGDNLSYNELDIINAKTFNIFYTIYEIAGLPLPKNNLLEELELNYTHINDYTKQCDTSVFNTSLSTPIAFGPEGTIYDSVFVNENKLYYKYFPLDEESYTDDATLILCDETLFNSLLESIASKTNYNTKEDLPNEWIIDVLMPYIFSQSMFENHLEYDEIENEMENIRGVKTQIQKLHIDESSKTECSNGVIYEYLQLSIPDSIVNTLL